MSKIGDLLDKINEFYLKKADVLNLNSYEPDKCYTNCISLHSEVNIFYNNLTKVYIQLKKDFELKRKEKLVYLKTEENISLTNKSEIDTFLEGYEELAELTSEIRECERAINSLEELIKSLTSFNYSFKAYIDYIRYRDGIV